MHSNGRAEWLCEKASIRRLEKSLQSAQEVVFLQISEPFRTVSQITENLL
jgi:hypothetical protein